MQISCDTHYAEHPTKNVHSMRSCADFFHGVSCLHGFWCCARQCKSLRAWTTSRSITSCRPNFGTRVKIKKQTATKNNNFIAKCAESTCSIETIYRSVTTSWEDFRVQLFRRRQRCLKLGATRVAVDFDGQIMLYVRVSVGLVRIYVHIQFPWFSVKVIGKCDHVLVNPDPANILKQPYYYYREYNPTSKVWFKLDFESCRIWDIF